MLSIKAPEEDSNIKMFPLVFYFAQKLWTIETAQAWCIMEEDLRDNKKLHFFKCIYFKLQGMLFFFFHFDESESDRKNSIWGQPYTYAFLRLPYHQ